MIHLCSKMHCKRITRYHLQDQDNQGQKNLDKGNLVRSRRGHCEVAPADERVGHGRAAFWFSEPGDWNLSFKRTREAVLRRAESCERMSTE